MQNMNSEIAAQALVESVLPTEYRRKDYLAIFADMIALANTYGPGKWGVKCLSDRIRLHVGPVIIATLVGDHIWLALDEVAACTSAEIKTLIEEGSWRWDETEYPRYPLIGSRNGHLSPTSDHAKIWQKLRPMHREAIKNATLQRKIDRATAKDHCPPMIEYIRKALGRPLPEPFYR